MAKKNYKSYTNSMGKSCRIKISCDVKPEHSYIVKFKNEKKAELEWNYQALCKTFHNKDELAQYLSENVENDGVVFKVIKSH